MTEADRLELAGQARANVGRAITLLERPDVAALDQGAAELHSAIVRIQQIQQEGPTCPSKPVLIALRNDLQRVGLLLRNAWELRVGRGGQLGYTRKGELLTQPTIRRMLEA